MSRTILRTIPLWTFVFLPIAPALAQTATQTAETTGESLQDDATDASDDIVVTALRRNSTVQTTPLSIVAISGTTLSQTGSTQLEDYFRQIPNVNLSNAQGGASRISIRGVNARGDATVGLYYDETPVTGPAGVAQDSGAVAADLNLFDVERVEVLRGPQGTLYGASSMAGTLRVVFNKPDLEDYDYAGEAQVSTTRRGSSGYYVKGMVNAPVISGKLAVRASGYYEQRPGWIDNVRFGTRNINDKSSWGLRGLVAFRPADDTNITATAIYQKATADDQQGWYPSVGRYQTNSPARLPFNSRMQLYNLKLEQGLGFGTLTATASWYKYDYLRAIDFSPSTTALSNSPAACRQFYGIPAACTPAQFDSFRATGLAQLPAIGYQPAFVRSQNHEIRITSNDNMPDWLQWTLGAYYEKRHDHIDSQTVSGDPATGNVYQPLRLLSYRYVETDARQVAAFGDISIKPVSGLTLTAGARYYDYKKTTSGESFLTNIYTGSVKTPFSSASADANGWLGKFNLSYQITPRMMVYATASKGFRPGGANNVPRLPANLVAYDADSLWNYELGFKSSWLDNAVVFNAAVFDIEWSSMQTVAATPDGLFAFITNAGKARIRGGEADISIRPVTGLTLNGSVGYSDAKLIEDQADGSVLVTAATGRKGDRIPDTPAWSGSASVNYSWPVSDRFDGLLRADFAYTGRMQSVFRPTDPNFTTYGDYATVDLRAGIENDKVGIYIFCKNVGDTVGNVGVTNGFGYKGLTYSIMPRTFGLNVRFGR